MIHPSWLTFNLLFTPLLLTISVAQNIYGYGDKAGQTIDVDIVEYGSSNCNRSNLTYYNASSSITVDAFVIPDDVPGASVVSNLTSLTFTMGVVEGPLAVPVYQNISAQLFWVTPSPYIALDSSALPYNGCSTIISSLTSQVNAKGQGDNGSCTTLFDQECVDALIAQAKEMALTWSGQEGINPNCSGMGDPPPACQQFGVAGGIEYLNLTWLSDGLGVYDKQGLYNGNPNVSSVWLGNPDVANTDIGSCDQTGAVILEENDGYSANYTLDYDAYVITVTPVLTAVWLKEERDPPWSDARLVCLRPNQFSLGSRIPATPTVRVSGAPAWENWWNSGIVWIVPLVWAIAFL